MLPFVTNRKHFLEAHCFEPDNTELTHSTRILAF